MPYLLDTIATWGWHKKLLLTAFICLLVIIFSLRLDIIPLYRTIQLSKQVLNQELLIYKKDSLMIKKLDVYQQLALKRQQALQRQASLLSQNKQATDMIRTISTLANQNKLQLLMIKPQIKIVQSDHTVLPIEITIQGNFHGLEQWLTDLFKTKPIMLLHNFSIYISDDNDIEKNLQNKLDMKLLLYVYQSKS